MKTLQRMIVAISGFVNRVLVRMIKLSSVVVSVILLLISALLIGLFFADDRFADHFFSHYAMQQAFQNGLDDFVKVSSFLGQNKILFLTIAILMVGGLFALKFFLRKTWTKDLNKHRLLTNLAYLLTNICISSVIVVSIFSAVIIMTVVMYLDQAIVANTSLASQSPTDAVKQVGDTIKKNTLIGRVALAKAIYAFEQNPDYLAQYTREERLAFCLEINRLIDLQGGPKFENEHYLRNFLNEAPPTLDEMLQAIQQGAPEQWQLLPPQQSTFHMYGENGEYNLKFVSKNGLYEAVYNRDGVLLTEQNDPVNMGTYNYADPISTPQKHSIYDVLPYFEWGNTLGSDIPSRDETTTLDRFRQNNDAVLRHEKIKLACEQAARQ